MSRTKTAFTLIELLVVICIIALLASILFPVFARVRENARRASCQSNLKQLSTAMEQYVQDYDGVYPYSTLDMADVPPGGNWASNTLWYWPQIIWAYHRSAQVFRCPSAPSYPVYVNSPQIRNYGANENILADDGDPLVKQVQIAASSKTYLFMDAAIYRVVDTYAAAPSGKYEWLPGNGDAVNTSCAGFSGIFAGLVSDCQRGRHFGGVNVAFADGHVKWLPTGQLAAESRKAAGPVGSGVYARGAWEPKNS